MQFAQLSDRVADGPAEVPKLDLSAFPGSWSNSNPATTSIARLKISESNNGGLSLQAFGIGPDGLIDWGKTDLAIFASSASSSTSAGFECVIDFGFAEVLLQG